MQKPLKLFAAGILTAVFTLGAGSPGGTRALPMFARKYGVSCATCHTTPPRLNEAGYRFRAAGFRMPEEIGKKPEAPFDIYDYVSARVQVRAEVSRSKAGTSATTRHQFLVQALEFYPFTGAWGKYLSTDVKLTLTPVSSPGAAIENAYVKFNAGDERRFLSARVGIFHPYDGYGAADSPATISRPLFQTTPAQFDQPTFFKPWGFDEAGGEVGFDYRRTSLRAALLGGIVLSRNGDKLEASARGPLAGRPVGPGHDGPDFQLFVNHVLHPEGGGVSLRYYRGNLALPVSGTGGFFRNRFDRTEIYGSYPAARRLHLFAGYERGRDRTAAGGHFSSAGAFAEAGVPINALTAAGVRYDWFDPALRKAGNSLRGLTAYVNAWFYGQLRVAAEYQHRETRREPAPAQADNALQVRFIYIK